MCWWTVREWFYMISLIIFHSTSEQIVFKKGGKSYRYKVSNTVDMSRDPALCCYHIVVVQVWCVCWYLKQNNQIWSEFATMSASGVEIAQASLVPTLTHSSLICTIHLLTLICFLLLLNSCWIEQNNEFGIVCIIKSVTILPSQIGHRLDNDFFFLWILKWSHPYFSFSPSQFAEMMVCREKVLSDLRS